MPNYLFPEVERVIYGKTPLREVICQVRFPADLRIDTTPPAEFQQRIRAQFPVLLTQPSRPVLPEMPPEIARAYEAAMPPFVGPKAWAFNTEDGKHTLQLVNNSLTLISRNYRRWEEFSRLFEGPLTSLIALYAPPYYTRVGLRYQDVIQRSKFGLGDASWNTLLKPHVLAEVAEPGFETRTEEAFRNVLFGLPEHNAKVRLQHGLAGIEGSTESVYLIDCDFFVERTEIADVDGALQYFHGNAARFFRWCITDALHKAMLPGPVV